MDRALTIKYFKDPPTLFTERLVLRRLLKSDHLDMFEYASNPGVTKYLLWEPHTSERYTFRYLQFIQSKYRSGEFYDWAVVDKRTGKMIGTCGFTRFDFENNSAEIGYVLNPAFWHRGIAAEAVRRVLDFGFTILGLHRIEAKFMVGNDNSRRVMEKSGMTFEGILRDSLFIRNRYVSVGVCSITEAEFEALYL